MKKKYLLTVFATILVNTTYANELSTTTAEQTGLNVTIYNSNIALVKDKRELTLPTGVNTLAFKDVSANIQPETAILMADGVTLLEQNFEYDLLTPESLLNKFVGKQVTLERLEDDKTVKETAEVLANNNGAVLKVDNQIRTNHGLNNIVFDDVPADLRDRPTLTMIVDNKIAEKQPVELSYLTHNLNWKADYVLSLRDNKTLDLKGWVTLSNNSGATYKDAKLQLVAGEVNRVQAPMPVVENVQYLAKSTSLDKSAPMSEESLFEYHLYSLGRSTTIKNNQQKQVSLLEANTVPYMKRLTVNARDPYGWRAWNNSEWQELSTVAELTIDNKKANNIGMPMPAGVIRTYQKDSQGNAQFIGEDRIKHTPENETIALRLGESFDVTAKRKQTDFHSERQTNKTAVSKVKKTVITTSYEVLFKNAKENEVTVDYQEYFIYDWELKEQSLNSKKVNSTLNRWKVKVPAKGETTLTFTVEMSYNVQ